MKCPPRGRLINLKTSIQFKIWTRTEFIFSRQFSKITEYKILVRIFNHAYTQTNNFVLLVHDCVLRDLREHFMTKKKMYVELLNHLG
jgi:hypothetical protein